MQLDLRTVFAICALCTFVVAAAIFFGVTGEDRRRSGSGLVASGMLFMGAGLGLEGTRGLLSPWISFLAANAVLCSGALLFWSGLRRLYELPGRPYLVVLLLAVMMVVDGSFIQADRTDSVTRSVLSSLLIGLIYAVPAILVVRRFDQWLGRAHYVVAAAFLAEAAALVARAAWGLLGASESDYSIVSPHPMNQVFGFVLLGNIVLVSYGFLLMLRERELLKLAMLDGLTGVMNRRAMLEAMDGALALALRTGSRCSVLMLDLDRFKSFNDAHGHAAGDVVLQRFAATVAGLLRTGDVLGRYGGEEFALLLPGTPAEGALAFAARLRAALAANPISVGPVAFKVTASIGVAQWRPGEPPDFARLLEAADRALYQAKQDGRDRAVLANPASTAVGGD